MNCIILLPKNTPTFLYYTIYRYLHGIGCMYEDVSCNLMVTWIYTVLSFCYNWHVKLSLTQPSSSCCWKLQPSRNFQLHNNHSFSNIVTVVDMKYCKEYTVPLQTNPAYIIRSLPYIWWVGFTKFPFVSFFVTHIFYFANISVEFFEPLSYLTGANTAERRHLSNIYLVFNRWPSFW